ncbi:MAG TPA: hypothetical protein VGS20_06390 [Candidatus Acidoferrales bacterium]|nr:hypothetical protein [Candidatus Acidoferrales bacterium]
MSNGIIRSGLVLLLTLGCAAAGLVVTAGAMAQEQQQQPAYTYAEYNAYTAATKETNLEQRIKLLDDFVSKFPNSTLMPYVYQTYYQTYNQLKQYDKAIEYADKLVDSTDKTVDNGMRLTAIYAREVAFNYSFDEKAPDATAKAQKAHDDAVLGLKLLDQIVKPANTPQENFDKQKQTVAGLFTYTEGASALALKNYPEAEKAFHTSLTGDPNNAVTYFRLGLAYLSQAKDEAAAAPSPATTPPAATPPAGATPVAATQAPLPGPSAGQDDYLKGFWALARSIALRGPTEAQVRTYLQNQMLVFQKTGCQDLLTAQMNDLLQQATSTTSIDPPATYSIPSGAQLSQYLQSTNLFNIMQDLQSGGDRAKFVWLAVCGNEFPDVPAKVIEAAQSADGMDFHMFSGATPADIQGATAANEEVKVVNQPDAQRVAKDNIVRFTGTLASYDPAPNFMLHWDKASINVADIPAATAKKGRGERQ